MEEAVETGGKKIKNEPNQTTDLKVARAKEKYGVELQKVLSAVMCVWRTLC